jgi:hypothetical protein
MLAHVAERLKKDTHKENDVDNKINLSVCACPDPPVRVPCVIRYRKIT